MNHQASVASGEDSRFEGALFENVSHELKTPLTVIRLALEQPELDRAEVAQAVSRLHRTIDNLLIAARLDADAIHPSPEWCDPVELIRVAVQSVDPEGHEIRIATTASLPFIFVDPAFTDRSIALLLVNGIIHSPAPSPVEVEARQVADRLLISVRDVGLQLIAGEESKVFDKFYSGGRRFTDGLLGLWVARQLVEAQGGEIGARNLNDGHVEFFFSLPLQESMQLPPEKEF